MQGASVSVSRIWEGAESATDLIAQLIVQVTASKGHVKFPALSF